MTDFRADDQRASNKSAPSTRTGSGSSSTRTPIVKPSATVPSNVVGEGRGREWAVSQMNK